MDWQELIRHFDETYDFFDRIHVRQSSAGENVSVHPLVKLCTGLALKAMESPNNNRLVILLPNRLQSARWIATFAAFWPMRQDYCEKCIPSVNFEQGQKLRVDNCVVEFVSEELSPELGQHVIWVKCSKGARYAITLDRKLRFHPVHTKRQLSPLDKVQQAVRSAQQSDTKELDAILGIRSLGNRSFFEHNVLLVSKVGATSSFVHEHYINSKRIIDLFQWGKVEVDGQVDSLTPGQYAAEPTCLFAANLYGAAEYIASGSDKTKGIVVDGVDACAKDLQRFDDDILDRVIPVVVVADLFDTDSLSHLQDRGFKIWQWNKDNLSRSRAAIPDTKTNSVYSSLNRSLTNFCHQQITPEICEHPQLMRAAESTWNLRRSVDLSENTDLQWLYAQVVGAVNRLSRLVWSPDPAWCVDFCERIQRLQEDFALLKPWLNLDTSRALEDTLGSLKSLGKNPCDASNHKVDRLRRLISSDQSSSDVSFVVLPSVDDVRPASEYWLAVADTSPLDRVHFVAPSDVQAMADTLSPAHIIVCGWLNHKRMYPLIHSHVVPQITVLLYHLEANWFESARREWRKRNEYPLNSGDFSDMLKLPKPKLKFIDYVPEISSPESEEAASDIMNFEILVRRYTYSPFVLGGGSDAEAVKAKLAVFTQNMFVFATETHRLLVVSDLMQGETSKSKIPRRTIDELKVGDYVLFRESDKDIIREIADSALDQQGLLHLRQVAGLWREALREKHYETGSDLEQLTLLLWEAGCERQPSTINNWLFDEDQIGPADRKDLERVAEVTGHAEITDRLQEIIKAISAVRGAHLQASRFITDRLLRNLPAILDSEPSSPGDRGRSVVLELDNFGQIMILRVEEIDEEWRDVEVKWVNRLLDQEDD